MTDYYDKAADIQRFVPPPEDGLVRLPSGMLDGLPYTIANLASESLVFVAPDTVPYDQDTLAPMVDTFDRAQALPTTEFELRSRPALMHVVRVLGQEAVDGYLIDYRYVGLLKYRDAGLNEGAGSEKFLALQQKYGTVLPMGVLVNNAGVAEYHGVPTLHEQACHMAVQVDRFIAETSPFMPRFEYRLPAADPRKPVATPGVKRELTATTTSSGQVVPLRDVLLPPVSNGPLVVDGAGTIETGTGE